MDSLESLIKPKFLTENIRLQLASGLRLNQDTHSAQHTCQEASDH